jgi:hypothetical protein
VSYELSQPSEHILQKKTPLNLSNAAKVSCPQHLPHDWLDSNQATVPSYQESNKPQWGSTTCTPQQHTQLQLALTSQSLLARWQSQVLQAGQPSPTNPARNRER